MTPDASKNVVETTAHLTEGVVMAVEAGQRAANVVRNMDRSVAKSETKGE